MENNEMKKKIDSDAQRPMTPAAAGEFLGFDTKTITRWARQGYIPAHPVGEGKRKFWRFFAHELSAWLNGQSNGALIV